MQGNAAHQAVGALRDEGGDDRYSADWYAQGMGLDVAVGVLYDDAGGDVYGARGGSQGAATANGFGLLAGGAGRFELAEDKHGWGRAEWLRGLPSVALLLHADGARFIRAASRLPRPRTTRRSRCRRRSPKPVHHPIPASRCSAACAMRRTLKRYGAS